MNFTKQIDIKNIKARMKNIFLGAAFFIIIFATVINHPILVFAKSNYHEKDRTKISSLNKRNNIFFILIDTLRADHLGCYGYKRNTSPNIDKIAGEGVIFTNFYTVCPWTHPTIASLFTGKYPQAIFPPAEHEQAMKQVLPEEIDTLAEVLRKEGYRTIALVDHPRISKVLNYDQGFDEFVQMFDKWTGKPAPLVIKEVSERLDKINEDYFFVYLHLIYPHWPYEPPSPYNEVFGKGYKECAIEEKECVIEEKEGMINMYDGEIKYTDELIGGILDNLRKRKLLNNTYIIITSDHGEGFWEHGLAVHGNSLYNELLKVPLIIYFPGGRRTQTKTIDGLVSNIDLFPTIMDFAKIENFPKGGGKSLFRYFDNKNREEDNRMIFSESPHSLCIKALSCQNERYKFIWYPPSMTKYILLFNPIQLYDIKEDPFEKHNLAMLKIFTSIKMGLELFKHKIFNDRERRALKQKSKELDNDAIKKLKSLGYLQ